MLLPRYSPPSENDSSVANASLVRWRYVAMLMLFAGGALVEFGLATKLVTTSSPAVVHAAAAVFALLGLVTRAVTPRWYRPFARVVILATILAITVLAHAFDGIVTVPIYYVWPLLGAAYLLTRADVVVFTILSIVGGIIGGHSPELGVPDYVSIGAVSLVVVVAVRVLTENLGTTIRKLRRASSTDPLTGLLNRRAMDWHVKNTLRQGRTSDEPLTVLVLDVDHFKRINDQFGHAVGDAALMRFAQLLTTACRGSDRVARMGGEEFAVLMPGATSAHAAERAARFAETLREDRTIDGLRMTVSGGIATATTSQADWDELLRRADDAVYRAKHGGRDRILIDTAASGRFRTRGALPGVLRPST
jgi:diguanylate cyclase (GGDEF)-like protein